MFSNILMIVQLVLAILLVIVVLLQQKGSGLGSAFGGSGAVYTTRRGLDKTLYNMTIVISILFFVTALINVII